MLVGVVKRMLMPTNFGIIHAVNTLLRLNQREGGLIRVQVVKDIDKGFGRGEVNFDMENVNIHDTLFNVLHQRCVATGVSQFKKELRSRYGSHAKLSLSRLCRVTAPSHIK